ncbi:hypothetical protein [uncultured Tateyamaria sp.]|uniref:hypothetical protein n=1 Tax=uncultured Tateyamaria sp. TaxID=455651 RepID=UPI00261E930E|nr:hypothetical protein [uncultured Tateyamaria sp.]
MTYETGNTNVSKTLIALPLSVLEIPENARAIGIAMGDLSWPRRKVVDRLQLRYEYFLDAGHQFRTYDGDVFDVGKDRLDGLFNDPGYKWLSEFPKRCRRGALGKAPARSIQMRLQMIELGLRTPAYGYAI